MTVTILQGDVREVLAGLPSESFDCIVTSPPYWGLRDYGCAGQIGLEPTLEGYLETMVGVCGELRRVLKPAGTFWLNIGDSYAGSGRGGYPGGKSGLDGTTLGQDNSRSARGSQKAAGFHEKLRLAGTVSRAWVAPPHGLKPKDLCMVPARLALALQADGWRLRSEIIWAKPNPMPESCTDRPTSAHEKIFLLTKSGRYYFDGDAVREPSDWNLKPSKAPDGWDSEPGGRGSVHRAGREKCRKRGVPPRHEAYESSDQSGLDAVGRGSGRNIRNVWTMASRPFKEAHFATFPPELAERCIKAGSPMEGSVLDPFGGAGTTGLVADRLGRDCTLIELNPAYVDLAQSRIKRDAPLFAEVTA